DAPVRKSRRKVIGHATSETMMHPNDTFRYLFPNLWNEHYGSGKLPEHILHSGLYALTLGIGHETGLYRILQNVYGPLYGNILMDYAMNYRYPVQRPQFPQESLNGASRACFRENRYRVPCPQNPQQLHCNEVPYS
ncbi:MAG: hypothetical protein PHT84_02245, partial [Candidatus Pacebacteria bacterium]|nr:hypothetical protein [Candidatus Paceibacterota bacterium]